MNDLNDGLAGMDDESMALESAIISAVAPTFRGRNKVAVLAAWLNLASTLASDCDLTPCEFRKVLMVVADRAERREPGYPATGADRPPPLKAVLESLLTTPPYFSPGHPHGRA